ncbi:MAG: hypothetical protein C4555_07155 [Dehalococcoidia bacterium]|nr:MAG: hypothetical protein C4555_07155 [Dehalococcoidia bacterium]
MSRKKEYIGKLKVALSNNNTIEVKIHKSGRTIWINDQIVHASNRDSFDGVIHEIGVVYNMPVANWEWVESVRVLKFRKYKK